MRRIHILLAIVAALMSPLASVHHAPAAPVTVHDGQTIIFNFDLTGSTPPPPFGSVRFYPGWAGLDAGEAFSATFFSSVNGGGSSFGGCLGFLSGCDLNAAAFTDGLFSWAATSLAGEFTVDPGALGLTANFQLVNPPGSYPPTHLSAGQTIIFNFDLTGSTPPPPFGSVRFYPGWDGLNAGDALAGEFFPEPNGGGSSLGALPCGLGVNSGCDLNAAGFTDGVFSWAATALAGDFTVAPGAVGLTPNFALVTPGRAVPQPATLGLLAAALLCAVARRYVRGVPLT